MSRRGAWRAHLIGAALLCLILPETARGAVGAATITGIARDPVGNLLHEVEVLVLPEASGGVPLATTRTDGTGRYRVSDLTPGIYRIAGLKPGYALFLGRVNTLLRSSLDLLLQPVPPGNEDADPVAEDLRWALRLPERSLLRDLDPGATEGSGGPTVYRAALGEVLQGRVEQLFSMSELLSRGSEPSTQALGTGTRVRLAGALGERGRVWLTAHRETAQTQPGRTTAAMPAARRATELQLNASYDPTLDNTVSARTFFSRHELDTSVGSEMFEALREAERSWGWDASWSRRIDADSRVAVAVDYRDSVLEVPAGVLGGASLETEVPEVPEVPGGLSNRALATEASYESAPSGRHRVHVGVRAQMLDLAVPLLRAAGNDLFTTVSGPEGWSLRLNAQDSWAVSAPVSLEYGLGYEQAFDGRGGALLVPRFGGIWSGDSARARVAVSYYAGRVGSRENAGRAVSGVRALGYEAEARVPLPLGLRLRGALSFAPVRYDNVGFDADETVGAHRPNYVNDRNPSAREASVSLERQAAATTAWVEFTEGSAEGMVASLPFSERSASLLAGRKIRYWTSRLGLRVAPSGTDVVAEYRSVGEVSDSDAASDRAPVGYVEVRLAQDLMRLDASGTLWRLLLVARAPLGVEESDTPTGGDLGALARLNRQLSAGVSVTF